MHGKIETLLRRAASCGKIVVVFVVVLDVAGPASPPFNQRPTTTRAAVEVAGKQAKL